jgi:hypothetical protein
MQQIRFIFFILLGLQSVFAQIPQPAYNAAFLQNELASVFIQIRSIYYLEIVYTAAMSLWQRFPIRALL